MLFSPLILNAQTCTVEDGPIATDNGQFTIDLLSVERSGQYVTFTWEVCRGTNYRHGLSHWVLSLAHIDCLADGKSLADLVVDTYLNGALVEHVVGNDPTTGVFGVKFDDLPGLSAACNTFAVTFDEGALADGRILEVGCVLASTKAGNQDVRGRVSNHGRPDRATVAGPVCGDSTVECDDETAFAFSESLAVCFGSLIDTPRWGWTIGPLPESELPYHFPLYAAAGQCDLTNGTHVGTVTVLYTGGVAQVDYQVFDGYVLKDTHLYVGCDPFPLDKRGNPTVAPGLFPHTGASNTITGLDCEGGIFVIAHAVVEICE
jgi:hypothetical protein